MSELLDGILEARRQDSLEYQEHLAKLLELAARVGSHEADVKYPDWATTQGKRALVDFLYENPELALEVDAAILHTKYIVVHEMAHLRERGHGERFTSLMDELMPNCRSRRTALNDSTLAAETWPVAALD